ncbi:MAG: methyltransferase domain-containing protein [Blastocatellia bacterium]
MTRRKDAVKPDAEETEGVWTPKVALPVRKQPMIATWLSEFEEQIARDFYRRTGLDYKTTIAQIIDAADPFPGMQVLDVPTGTGVIARQFVGKIGEKGKITGGDMSRENLEKARLAAYSAKVSMRIEWRQMMPERLSFGDSTLDLITSVMAFHRMQAQKFIDSAYRVLKPGGRLLIADELAPKAGSSSLKLKFRRHYYRYIARDPREAAAHFYTADEVMEMLHEREFKQIVLRAIRQRSEHDRVFTLIKAVK